MRYHKGSTLPPDGSFGIPVSRERDSFDTAPVRPHTACFFIADFRAPVQESHWSYGYATAISSRFRLRLLDSASYERDRYSQGEYRNGDDTLSLLSKKKERKKERQDWSLLLR